MLDFHHLPPFLKFALALRAAQRFWVHPFHSI